MKASSLSFKLAVLFVIAGMSMGMGMAISQDHSIMPAHAHLNLLGWVSLFLFGTYYERRPALDASRLAIIQVWGWSIGTAVLTFGVAAEHMGYDNLAPFAAVGALIVFAGVLLFAYFVFRPPTSMASGPAVGLTPCGITRNARTGVARCLGLQQTFAAKQNGSRVLRDPTLVIDPAHSHSTGSR